MTVSSPEKELYDLSSMLKDLEERKQIIQRYQRTGYLDRANAIRKIQELRMTDADVAAATVASLAVSSTPFEQVSDQGIVAELQMQANVLTAELLKNTH